MSNIAELLSNHAEYVASMTRLHKDVSKLHSRMYKGVKLLSMQPPFSYTKLSDTLHKKSDSCETILSPTTSLATQVRLTTVHEVVELPATIYKKYRGKFLFAVLLYMDSEPGWKSIINPTKDRNMKGVVIIELQTDTPTLYATPTRALKDPQDNTENGWAGWRVLRSRKTLREHRVETGGAGFKNPPQCLTHHRDTMTMHCIETKKVKQYYHSNSLMRQARRKLHIDETLFFITRSNMEINKIYEARIKNNTSLAMHYPQYFTASEIEESTRQYNEIDSSGSE
jgi:hypothetical protein